MSVFPTKFPGGTDPTRVHIVGHNEWRGQSGVAHGTRAAHKKKNHRYQRLAVLVELDETGERIEFFEGELVFDNPLERLASVIDDEEWDGA